MTSKNLRLGKTATIETVKNTTLYLMVGQMQHSNLYCNARDPLYKSGVSHSIISIASPRLEY